MSKLDKDFIVNNEDVHATSHEEAEKMAQEYDFKYKHQPVGAHRRAIDTSSIGEDIG